jgi:hypothetical protein
MRLISAGTSRTQATVASRSPATPPAIAIAPAIATTDHTPSTQTTAAASAQGLDCYPVEGFKSEANDRYVVAELDYGIAYPRHNLYGMLRAHATAVGPWEKFQFCHDKATNLWSIFSNANHRWVATQLDYPGRDKYMLRAQATGIGPWEQYHMTCVVGGKGKFVIYSYASKRYVAAELNYTGKDYGMLRARSDTTGAWEIFTPDPACPS